MKNIKDYLKYYVGQLASVNTPYDGIEVKPITFELLMAYEKSPEEYSIKPFLRRLISLTQNELDTIPGNMKYASAEVKEEWFGACMPPDEFHYLLSIGIDLFGLIDADLAEIQPQSKSTNDQI